MKDIEDAAGYPTTFGSVACADAPPAAADSVLVAALKGAGAIVVGKTNTPELAFKAETDNAIFGATRNPWDLDHTPGGSSGGSAAAVAAGMVPLATGSDGGGSIRIPAAVCGLLGLQAVARSGPAGGSKAPSWQHLSSKGVLAAHDARHRRWRYDAVIGPDPSDLRSLPMPEPSWMRRDRRAAPAAARGLVADARLRQGRPRGPAVCASCGRRRLADLGAEIVEIDDRVREPTPAPPGTC